MRLGEMTVAKLKLDALKMGASIQNIMEELIGEEVKK